MWLLNKVPGLIKKSVNEAREARRDTSDDKLKAEDLVLEGGWLLGQSGIPTNTDSCAYEPIQRLLAIATSDGRIKLMGSAGVEKTLQSRSKHPYGTSHLQFLYNRGVLVRVSEAGFMEAWSVCNQRGPDCVRALAPLRLETDHIMMVASMPRDAYLLLGCTSGALRIAALVDANSTPVTEARLVKGFALQAYRVMPEQVKAEGPVIDMAIQSGGALHRVLMVHKKSGLAVWDIRGTRLVAHLNPRLKSHPQVVRSAGAVCSATWIGTRLGDLASGHTNGTVLIWALPPASAASASGAAPAPIFLSSLRVVTSGAAACPIRSLRFANGRRESLLVVGGQEEDEPDSLMLISLPAVRADRLKCERTTSDDGEDDTALAEGREEQEEAEAKEEPEQRIHLPWFGTTRGYSLVSAGGAISGFEDPAAIIQLVDDGQMVVHDLEYGGAAPFTLPFQNQPASITCVAVNVAPAARPAGLPHSSLCVAQMRKLDMALRKQNGPGAQTAASTVVTGGVAPFPFNSAKASVLYLTGHSDGYVRVWDLYSEQPMLLATAPSQAAVRVPGGSSLKAVTALELVWEHGILLSGHRKGEVRMYQWSDVARCIECHSFDRVGSRAPKDITELEEFAGFQLKLRTYLHTAEIRCVKYCAIGKVVAVGDKHGAVSLLDVSRPSVLWCQTPSAQPIASLQLALAPWPPSRQRSAGVAPPPDEACPARTLFVILADSTTAALDCKTGLSVAKTGASKPKSASTAIQLELLDANGQPLWMSRPHFLQSDLAACGSGGEASRGAGSSGRGHSRGRPGRTSADKRGPVAEGKVHDDSDEEGEDHGSSGRHRGSGGKHGGGRRSKHASRADDGEDEEAEEGQDGGDDDDVDVDELLARAAQEIDLQSKSKKSKKSSKSVAAKTPPPPPPAFDRKDPSRRTQTTHSSGGTDSDGAGDGNGSDASHSGSGSSGGGVATACSGAIAGSGPEGVTAYVLLVTDASLRVHDVKTLMSADRTPLYRVWVDVPIVYASTFHVEGAPAVLVLTHDDMGAMVKVYTLPGLQLLHEMSLSTCVGSHWQFPPSHLSHLDRLVAVSELGHMLLLGPGNELLQVAIAAGLPQPLQPTSMYDWELAAAAHAASLAYEQAQAQSAATLPERVMSPAASGSVLQERAPSGVLPSGGGGSGGAHRGTSGAIHDDYELEEENSTSPKYTEGRREGSRGPAALPGKALNGVFTGVNKAFTGAGKGVLLLGGMLEKGVNNIGQAVNVQLGVGGGGGSGGVDAAAEAEAVRGLPDLAAVFSMSVPESQRPVVRMKSARGSHRRPIDEEEEEDDDDDILEISDDDIGITASGSSPAPQPPREAFAAAARDNHAATAIRKPVVTTRLQYTSDRDELMTTGPTQMRTASAIKKHYGRDKPAGRVDRAAGATAQVREVVEETRRKLNERGERLRRLDEKTSDLENSAAGFADMARQLAERERNKKWWQ